MTTVAALASSVSYSDVTTGVLTLGGGLVGLMLIVYGVKTIVRMVKSGS
jgi:hypothetical protein